MPASPVRIAAQLYTVSEFLKTPAEARAALRRVRDIGYAHAEIGGMEHFAPEVTLSLVAEAQLIPIGCHADLVEFRKQFDELVARIRLWNVAHVTLGFLPPEERADAAAYRALAREMNEWGRQLALAHIQFQHHNHDFEFIRHGGRSGLEILCAETDPRYVHVQLDTCWVARAGADPAAWISRMRGRMDQVHVKDTALTPTGAQFAAVGEGNLNWPAILRACGEIGVRDYIVEHDPSPATPDPFRSLEVSCRNLQAMGVTAP
jgi:sugar phosphate isomerase/epimerase